MYTFNPHPTNKESSDSFVKLAEAETQRLTDKLLTGADNDAWTTALDFQAVVRHYQSSNDLLRGEVARWQRLTGTAVSLVEAAHEAGGYGPEVAPYAQVLALAVRQYFLEDEGWHDLPNIGLEYYDLLERYHQQREQALAVAVDTTLPFPVTEVKLAALGEAAVGIVARYPLAIEHAGIGKFLLQALSRLMSIGTPSTAEG